MRALIVDDSRSMRAILGRVLRRLGIEVIEAGDGRTALDRLETGPLPDFALIDWHMPEMDGIQLVVQVRRHPEWTFPIMMVSTESDNVHISEAMAAGANEYMMKPFTPDAVSEKLELLGLPVSPAGVEETNG